MYACLTLFSLNGLLARLTVLWVLKLVDMVLVEAEILENTADITLGVVGTLRTRNGVHHTGRAADVDHSILGLGEQLSNGILVKIARETLPACRRLVE